MNKNRVCAVILAVMLVISPLSGIFAANGQHISVTSYAPTYDTTTVGQLYTLDLTQCFTDTHNHALTYSIHSNSDLGPHTHLGPENVEDHLYFTVQYPGNYDITITAGCADHDSASFVLHLTVDPASAGTSAQYNYNENSLTDPDTDTVKVYVTVSNDGMPIRGNDSANTKLACLEVNVPYFDLEDYGLEDYYRYDSEDNLVERPTLLHLYIYLLERYYMGLGEAYCGKGDDVSGVMSYYGDEDVRYMDGAFAYNNGSNGAISTSGSPQSLYFTNCWGHDENLMYFRNHMYPLMSDGWGATADYILLDDNDYIDIAMFSDWGFRFDGAFVSFQAPVFEAVSGTPMSFEVQKFDTSGAMGGTGGLTDMEDSLTFYVYSVSNGVWTAVSNPSITHTANTNDYSITLTTGTYYVVATEPGAPDYYACLAPAAMKIIVAAP